MLGSMKKFAPMALAAALGVSLAACGGSASVSPAAVPASPKTTAAGTAAKPASSTPASASAAAAPKPSVVGQRAPGPYTASGSVTATNGQATLDTTDTLKWQPDTVVAKPGDKITLQIKNTGNTAHTFLSPSLGVSNAKDVPTGKTVPVSFTAPTAPGAYQFWCNIPGHAEAGMVGEVIVR